MKPYGLSTLLMMVAACSYTDGGGGTRTLEVNARLTYEARNNQMEVRIEIDDRDGSPLNNAIVKITDGQTDQVYEISQRNPDAEYYSQLDGYHRRIELSIEKDSDRLDGKLEGPGVHRVTSPQNDEVLRYSDIGDNLQVEWETEDGIAAEEVTIRLSPGSFSHTEREFADPGSYDIPAEHVEVGDGDIRVTRQNKVRLDGGLGASLLQIEYEARNSFVVQQ